METKIKVKIERSEKVELVFYFEKALRLNLSSDSTEDTKNFFIVLLNEIVKTRKLIKFELEDGEEDLFHDVAEKYLENLEEEIKQLIDDMPKELN